MQLFISSRLKNVSCKGFGGLNVFRENLKSNVYKKIISEADLLRFEREFQEITSFTLIIEGTIFENQNPPRGISRVWFHYIESLVTSPDLPFSASACLDHKKFSAMPKFNLIYIGRKPYSKHCFEK